MYKFQLTLLFSLLSLYTFAQKITLSGYVREAGSKESLPSVLVMISETSATQTNNYGFFSITIASAEEVEVTFGSMTFGVGKNPNHPAKLSHLLMALNFTRETYL
ncbi:MAG: hypothetical protein ORN54_09385, partial [Cyclobacteriaceae bacterium]|nr:hypothetical protein [Cyclobacteriaceae bacterium]